MTRRVGLFNDKYEVINYFKGGKDVSTMLTSAKKTQVQGIPILWQERNDGVVLTIDYSQLPPESRRIDRIRCLIAARAYIGRSFSRYDELGDKIIEECKKCHAIVRWFCGFNRVVNQIHAEKNFNGCRGWSVPNTNGR